MGLHDDNLPQVARLIWTVNVDCSTKTCFMTSFSTYVTAQCEGNGLLCLAALLSSSCAVHV